MGGLLAARVLADAYRRVTIVERDPLPESGLDRKGVPQGRHAHGLLPSGAQILDELFPGLLADLVADGVPVVRAPREFRFLLRGPPAVPGRRTRRAVVPAEPAVPGSPCPRPGSGPAQRLGPGPVRGSRPGHHAGPRPGHWCPRAAARGRRRTGDPRRRSRRRRDRPGRAYRGVAEGNRLRPAGRGAAPGGHQVRQPASAAARRGARGREADPDRRPARAARRHGAVRAGGRPLDPHAGRVRRLIIRRPAKTGSSPSPAVSRRRTSSPRSATRNRSTRSAPTVSRPICVGATSG